MASSQNNNTCILHFLGGNYRRVLTPVHGMRCR